MGVKKMGKMGYGNVGLPFFGSETARVEIDYAKSRNCKVELNFVLTHFDSEYEIKGFVLKLKRHPEILDVKRYPLHIDLKVRTRELSFRQATRKCLDVIAGALNTNETF